MCHCRKEAADSLQKFSVPQKKSTRAGYETLTSSLERPRPTGLI